MCDDSDSKSTSPKNEKHLQNHETNNHFMIRNTVSPKNMIRKDTSNSQKSDTGINTKIDFFSNENHEKVTNTLHPDYKKDPNCTIKSEISIKNIKNHFEQKRITNTLHPDYKKDP